MPTKKTKASCRKKHTKRTTRRGVTLTELLTIVGIIAIVSAAAIPSYRLYMIKSDLRLAAEQTQQMLRRAQFLSQSGERQGPWGVRAEEGILFEGETFASRTLSSDELFPLPSSVTVSGLLEVTYSRVDGIPSAEGDIIFTALNGDQLRITVSADTVLRPPLPPQSSSAFSSMLSSSSKKKKGGSDDDDDGDEDEDDEQ